MAGKNDNVINANVYQCLIQMVPCDFELAPMLKEGGGNHEVVVVAKREELQAIFHGKIVFCGEIVLANYGLQVRKDIVDLNIKVPQNKRHIPNRDGSD